MSSPIIFRLSSPEEKRSLSKIHDRPKLLVVKYFECDKLQEACRMPMSDTQKKNCDAILYVLRSNQKDEKNPYIGAFSSQIRMREFCTLDEYKSNYVNNEYLLFTVVVNCILHLVRIYPSEGIFAIYTFS